MSRFLLFLYTVMKERWNGNPYRRSFTKSRAKKSPCFCGGSFQICR